MNHDEIRKEKFTVTKVNSQLIPTGEEKIQNFWTMPTTKKRILPTERTKGNSGPSKHNLFVLAAGGSFRGLDNEGIRKEHPESTQS